MKDYVTLAPGPDSCITPTVLPVLITGTLLLGIILGALVALGPFETDNKGIKYSSIGTLVFMMVMSLVFAVSKGFVPDFFTGYLAGTAIVLGVMNFKMWMSARKSDKDLAGNPIQTKPTTQDRNPYVDTDSDDSVDETTVEKSTDLANAESMATSAFDHMEDLLEEDEGSH